MEYYIILDTETTNSLEDPIVYDLGFAVVDENGEVYETHSLAIREVITDKELMSSAYYLNKLPIYWEEIARGDRKMCSLYEAKNLLFATCKKYGIKKLFAHNMRFDYRSLNLTQRFRTSSKYRYFFPFGVEFWDTLKMAREVLKEDTHYLDFCEYYNYKTKRNAPRFTAEIVYRFITKNNDFEEVHRGLDDVMIEKEIMKFCFDRIPNLNGELWGETPTEPKERKPRKRVRDMVGNW